ncbi:FG-GAP repeat domain-containing protein [Winogradskya consettensis]|nr:VCBS repeat-containing protein [Actinoplanes consettensis]
MNSTSSKFLQVVAAVVVAAGGVAVAGSPAAAYTPGYSFAGVADWDADGHQDVIARDSSGRLWLYPGESRRGYSSQSRVQIGNGWNGFTLAGIADWDHDGHQDIVTRDSSGRLWLYLGESKRGYSGAGRVQIGNGWTDYTVAGVEDWDTDGNQDIVARDKAGRLWLYPGQSHRGYSSIPRAQIGNGWSSYTFADVADWDGDHHPDIVTRDKAGRLWLYPGESKRGYSSAARVQIGNGWNAYTFADIADWDADHHQDILTRDNTGRLWVYLGESKRGYSAAGRAQIGNGW